MSIRAILVDDEEHPRVLFKKLLTYFDNEIEIVGEANNLPEGLKLLHSTAPDVLFLDVDMPKYSGLQIKDFIEEERPFEIVFVTAHSEYAIEALRMEATDYLLKPLDLDSLKDCIERLSKKITAKKATNYGQANQEQQSLGDKKIAIASHEGTYYINEEDIYYVEAAAMYCIVHKANEKITVSKPLGEFEQLLGNGFYRVHRSFLVNTKLIEKFSTKEGNEVVLLNGDKVPVSVKKKDAFKQFMVDNY